MKGGWHPLPRMMTIVLSNGATLRLPTAAARERPYFMNTDFLNHSMWLKGSGVVAEQTKKDTEDFSKFYKKFGFETDNDKAEQKKTRGKKLFR